MVCREENLAGPQWEGGVSVIQTRPHYSSVVRNPAGRSAQIRAQQQLVQSATQLATNLTLECVSEPRQCGESGQPAELHPQLRVRPVGREPAGGPGLPQTQRRQRQCERPREQQQHHQQQEDEVRHGVGADRGVAAAGTRRAGGDTGFIQNAEPGRQCAKIRKQLLL